MKKPVLLVLIFSTIFGIVFWRFGLTFLQDLNRGDGKDVEIAIWGLFEEERVYRPIIEAYEETHPKIKINYIKQSSINYRPRLQTQLRVGQGPDIFLIHSSWLEDFWIDLISAPDSIFNAAEFSKTYYPLASKSLIRQGKVYGIPRELDGLVLYYNEDILKGVGVDLPQNWQAFIQAARIMTVKNSAGEIQTAGAALGTATNVDYWPEILTLLFFQQPEGDLSSPANNDGAEVLKFYTNFITDPKNKTWDINLPSSTRMFTEGKLAFYFAPIGKAAEIRNSAPNLNFKIAPLPQLLGKNIGVGSFWSFVVSGRSDFSEEAWEFVHFLSLPEILQFLSPPENLIMFYPRVEMGKAFLEDPFYKNFLPQAPYYQGWYLNSGILDGGVNEEMIKVYKEAVDEVLSGGDPRGSLNKISPKVQEILQKYQINPK